MIMTTIVAVRYLAVSGLFAWLTRRRFPRLYEGRGAQMRREIGWSLTSAFIYAVPAGVLAWGWQGRGWTRIYSNLGDYPLWWFPLSILLYLLLHDSWIYWTHLLMHRPNVSKTMHALHYAIPKPTT